jgi:uncharacterized protein with gpF-like domain
MARRPTAAQRKRINDLLEPYTKEVRDAFLASVQNLADGVDLGAVIRALDAGDLNAAVQALNIEAAAFTPYQQALSSAFQAGGAASAAALPVLRGANGAVFAVRFDGQATGAMDWVITHAGTHIKEVVEDQIVMARNQLRDSLAAGLNPRDAALSLVGRLDRQTGRRVGGTFGLTDWQAGVVRNVRDRLTRGDPASLNDYLSLALRDKRFDKTVRNVIAGKDTLSKSKIDDIVRQYENRFLKHRGDTIARTEVMTALHAGQHEQLEQLIRSGKVKRNQVRRVWRTASDRRVRDSHGHMEGQSVGLDEPFVSGDGNRLLYPGDPNAPAADRINCRCDVTVRIDFLSNIRE